jgi:hypothetical protein
MKTIASPAKQKYIADLAMAAAAGKSLSTYPRSEARAALAILKRAGIRVPKSVSKPPIDATTVLLARVEQRMKEEAATFIRAVAVARAIYRLPAEGRPHYGQEMITLPSEKLTWLTKQAEFAGVALDIDDADIPARSIAFTNRIQELRDSLMKEAGLA